ncbi:MAG: hypothetical protein KGM49_06055 [Sphingomonadales bacterium]|nr:hypothetical protein [Sphingomonadales bacterium]
MPQSNTFSNRATAALSALVLSVMLFAGTVSTPAPARSSVAYVGVVA